MSRFHDRTLVLLGNEPLLRTRTIEPLIEWATENHITLPAAYLEWASLDDGSLLEKYSNDDSFWFDDLNLGDLIETDDDALGLRFNSENQGNFDRMVMLDQGDDPPVLFTWFQRPPIVYAERFSDAVFAQVFDWQYWLKFDRDDTEYREIGYYGNVDLKSDRCLANLRKLYEETVTTRFVVDGEHATEYRFLKSLKERITVTIAEDRSAEIRITGEGDLVPTLEAELLDLFADDVIPPRFNSLGWAADFLGRRIDNGWHKQISHAFSMAPKQSAIDRLIACHQAKPIRDRITQAAFPECSKQYSIGGADWGVTIFFRTLDNGWWCLETVAD